MSWPWFQICLSYIIAFRFHLKQNIIYKSNNKGFNDPSSPKDLTMRTHAEGLTDLLWERKYMQRCDGVCDARTISIRQCNIFGLLHVPWSMADIRCMADIRRAEDGYSEQDGVRDLGRYDGRDLEMQWDREMGMGSGMERVGNWILEGKWIGKALENVSFPHLFLFSVLPNGCLENIARFED